MQACTHTCTLYYLLCLSPLLLKWPQQWNKDAWMQDADDTIRHTTAPSSSERMSILAQVLLHCFKYRSDGSSVVGGSSAYPAFGGWIAGSSLLAEQTSFLQDQSVCKLHPATDCLNINQIFINQISSLLLPWVYEHGACLFSLFSLVTLFCNEWLCILESWGIPLMFFFPCFLDLKHDWVGSAEIRGCGLHLGCVHDFAFFCSDFTESMMD